MDIRSKEEQDAYTAFSKAVNDILISECHSRCPNIHSYDKRCEFCDVKHILNLVSSNAKIKSERMGTYRALLWLFTIAHPYMEEWDRYEKFR